MARFDERLSRYGRSTALSMFEDGGWRHMSFEELRHRSTDLAAHLRWNRRGPGERMAILSESRPEWAVAFLAVLRAGGEVVPLDTKLLVHELLSLLADARPTVVFVSRRYLDLARETLKSLSIVPELIVLEECATRTFAGLPCLPVHRDPSDVAVVTYTSGTTGRCKGVLTTFANLFHQVEDLGAMLPPGPASRALSILPMHHLFELAAGFLAIVMNGGRVFYGDSLFPEDMLRNLREQRIERAIVVPLFLELVKRSIENEVQEASIPRRVSFRLALELCGRVRSRRLSRFLFRAIHARLGKSLRYFVSGGAPLQLETHEFFRRIGVEILQGYGLAEMSPVVSVNTPERNRVGSVGQPLPRVEVRIEKAHPGDATGEILTRGPNLMLGYGTSDGSVLQSVDADGWFATGDIGRIDSDGYLFVTGRKKSVIVLGSGKNVQPEEVEARLAQAPLIEEICVVGVPSGAGPVPGYERVVAVVVPRDRASWAGLEYEMRDTIRREVEELSLSLAPFKRPSLVLMRDEELPRTSTSKVRRHLVRAWARRQSRVVDRNRVELLS